MSDSKSYSEEHDAGIWQCWNIACMRRNTQHFTACYSCGYERGHLDPEVKQLLEAHTNNKITQVLEELKSEEITVAEDSWVDGQYQSKVYVEAVPISAINDQINKYRSGA